jgi:plastocyanin
VTKALVLVIGSALAGAGLIATAVASSGTDAEGAASEPGPRAVVVEARGFAFAPNRVSAAVGDTIVWVNRDALPHTATAQSGAWDSGELGTEESWSFVATRAGTIDYLCAYHPTMRGRIEVVGD